MRQTILWEKQNHIPITYSEKIKTTLIYRYAFDIFVYVRGCKSRLAAIETQSNATLRTISLAILHDVTHFKEHVFNIGDSREKIEKVRLMVSIIYTQLLHFTVIWWRHQLKTLSVLLAICSGNSPVTL